MSAIIGRSPEFIDAGIVLSVLITAIGLRMVMYWTSFFLRPGRYRARQPVTTADLRGLDVPYIKVQWTTKGSPGSTEVILRGLRQLELLAQEDASYYRGFVSAEIVTQNQEQADHIGKVFADSPMGQPSCVVVPAEYQTANDTGLKARQMHYLVELRREGWNRKAGRTFIVHFDEDTLMRPDEFRKMIAHLAHTDKLLLTGPIHYPLEYGEASKLARATEASRPITCFECRRVMETGVPLHVHGSNLVCDEEFENRLGWDIGRTADGQPLVAEDYVFGMNAFLNEGSKAFGWHGAVALEQPPFSFGSVFRQRYRWIFGVLQGMDIDTHLESFHRLSFRLRQKVKWGTRYRIATAALGSVVGAFSMAFIPAAMLVAVPMLGRAHRFGPIGWLSAWFACIGIMWLGSIIVGAYTNVRHAGFTRLRRVQEIARAIVITPVAGIIENLAALTVVVRWWTGKRTASWTPTPSTVAADKAVNGTGTHGYADVLPREAPVPWEAEPARGNPVATAGLLAVTVFINAIYITFPLALAGRAIGLHLVPAAIVAVVATAGVVTVILSITRWTMRTPASGLRANDLHHELHRHEHAPEFAWIGADR
jgi:Glycosyl transferase family group 2